MRVTLKLTRQLLEAVNRTQMLSCDTDLARESIFGHMLQSFVELTGSEIGIIGQVNWREDGQPYARIRAVSAGIWEESPISIKNGQDGSGLKIYNLDSLIGKVMSSGEAVIINDLGPPSGNREPPPDHPELSTFMGLPIRVRGALVGWIGLANCKRGYDKDMAEFLLPLLNTCGLVISTTRSDREWLVMQSRLEAQRNRLEALVEERTVQISHDEEGIRANEAYLQDILRRSPNAILVSDLDTGQITFANQQALDMFGIPEYAVDLAVGEKYWADPAERESLLQQVRQEGRASGEAHLKASGGKILQVILTAQVNPGIPGEVVWWITDLTAHKEMQHELHQQRMVLERIVENLPVALWVKDINNGFRHTVFNKEAEGLFSIPAEMVLGKTDFDFLDAELARTIREEDLEVVRTGQNFDLPNDKIESMAGEIRYGHRVKIVVPDVDGNPSLILGLCDDLTEQRYAEQSLRASETRFKDLAEHAPVGIFLTDPRGACVFVNKTWQRMTGLDQEQAAGTGWMAALHQEDRADVDRAWKHFVGDGADFNQQYRLVRPDGQVTWVKATAISLHNEENQVTGFLRTTTDITEQKQFAAELEHSRDQAQRANAAKSEFLSRMSHELRTPLNAVLGFGQLLQMNNSNFTHSQNESVGYILDGGEHLLSLIEDVLDFSRIESGRIRLKLKAVPSRPIVQRSVSLITPLAQRREITIQYDDGQLPEVRADAHRLQQVLFNLLTNAIKYNRPGGTVSIDAAATPNGTVRFRVADSGTGIHPDDQPLLFEPFERGTNSNATMEGTGIGLSICKQLVESMGGEIGFESEYGTGSTFWFELPLAEPTEKER